jgi:hypothetical protein
MKCNKCKSSNVQKFQVIHEQGTSNINLGSNTVGGGVGFGGGGLRGGVGLGRTGTSGKSQTLIAEKTKPPGNDMYNASGGLLVFVIFIAIIFYVTLKDVDTYRISVWLTLIIGVYFISKVLNRDQTEYERQYQEWLNKWYCNKCGNSFISK